MSAFGKAFLLLFTLSWAAHAQTLSPDGLTIPNSAANIGNAAFAYCDSLAAITADTANPAYRSDDEVLFNNDGTTLIQYPARKSAAAFTVPSIVTTLADSAFSDCSKLTSVTIPFSVTSIAEHAFSYCHHLASITVDATNPNYSSEDGVLYNKDRTTLIQYPAGKPDTMFTIPNTVTTIAESAFTDCVFLTDITIPFSVTSIVDRAFSYCHSLTSFTVDLSNSAYSSEEGVLFNQDKTTLVQYPAGKSVTVYTIPNTVTTIGDSAFTDCARLASVSIPFSVTSIVDHAFSYCHGLVAFTVEPMNPAYSSEDGVLFNKNQTTLIQYPARKSATGYTIPDVVTTIGDSAFSDCAILTGVVIPASVTSIVDHAFSYCHSLAAFTVDTANPAYSSLDGVLFNKNQTTLIQYPPHNSASNYGIPLGVSTIGDSAFSDCSILTGVGIPPTVTSVVDHAFSYCHRLASIGVHPANPAYTSLDGVLFNKSRTTLIQYPPRKSLTSYSIPNSVTTVGDSAFSDCSILASVFIPSSVTSIVDCRQPDKSHHVPLE